jgi:transposase
VRPYSAEFRGEVLAVCDSGRGTRDTAKHFGVSESWVRRIKQQRREQNKVAPISTRTRTPLWAPIADRIRGLIERTPRMTLRELKSELGTDLSLSTLCVALQELRLTFKKSLDGGGTRSRRHS